MTPGMPIAGTAEAETSFTEAFAEEPELSVVTDAPDRQATGPDCTRRAAIRRRWRQPTKSGTKTPSSSTRYAAMMADWKMENWRTGVMGEEMPAANETVVVDV
eukprot:6993986-Prymnesium_polylepis.2